MTGDDRRVALRRGFIEFSSEMAGLQLPSCDIEPLWEQWIARQDYVVSLLAMRDDCDDIGLGWDG